MNKWMALGIAIVSETVATSAMKSSDGFTKLIPSAIVVVGYAIAFYFLSMTLKSIPVGIAYAIWSGVGIVLIALVSWLVFGIFKFYAKVYKRRKSSYTNLAFQFKEAENKTF